MFLIISTPVYCRSLCSKLDVGTICPLIFTNLSKKRGGKNFHLKGVRLSKNKKKLFMYKFYTGAPTQIHFFHFDGYMDNGFLRHTLYGSSKSKNCNNNRIIANLTRCASYTMIA